MSAQTERGNQTDGQPSNGAYRYADDLQTDIGTWEDDLDQVDKKIVACVDGFQELAVLHKRSELSFPGNSHTTWVISKHETYAHLTFGLTILFGAISFGLGIYISAIYFAGATWLGRIFFASGFCICLAVLFYAGIRILFRVSRYRKGSVKRAWIIGSAAVVSAILSALYFLSMRMAPGYVAQPGEISNFLTQAEVSLVLAAAAFHCVHHYYSWSSDYHKKHIQLLSKRIRIVTQIQKATRNLNALSARYNNNRSERRINDVNR